MRHRWCRDSMCISGFTQARLLPLLPRNKIVLRAAAQAQTHCPCSLANAVTLTHIESLRHALSITAHAIHCCHVSGAACLGIWTWHAARTCTCMASSTMHESAFAGCVLKPMRCLFAYDTIWKLFLQQQFTQWAIRRACSQEVHHWSKFTGSM